MTELESSFANNFWGRDDAGYQVLMEKVHSSKLTCDEVQAFYKERVAIEEDYARRLAALSKKGLGSTETGTLRDALDVVLSATADMAKSHAESAQTMKSELTTPLDNFAGSMRSRRKSVESVMEKLSKTKAVEMQSAEKSRQKFESDSNRIHGYVAQKNMLLGKELERNNAKLDRIQQSVDQTKREYQSSLRVLADTMDRWNKEWKNGCDRIQDLEEERINFLKSNLWAYANIVSTVCVGDDEGCENIRVALEKSDAQKDLESFVKRRGTGGEITNPPQFIDYSSGFHNEDAGPSYEIANFSRGESYDDRAADTLPLSSSGHHLAGDQEDNFDSETVLHHKGSRASIISDAHTTPSRHPSARPIQEDATPRSMGSAATAAVANSPFGRNNSGAARGGSGNPYDDDLDYNSIPVLSHPESDANSTARSSPIHGNASPISSMYSNNTSVSSASSMEQDVDSGESKRRTWASPFRKRSKKELRGSWNSATKSSPSSSLNGGMGNDESTITPKSAMAKNFAERQQTGMHQPLTHRNSANSPSSVLSMGENMFDLGVSRPQTGSKSPFDRNRTASPTKSLSKDDPLVAALERLKMSSADPRQQQQQPKERSRPSSPSKKMSAPMLSSNGPRNAELVPPNPAFTASEMNQTSERYSSQTRELFDRDQGPSPAPSRQRQMQRPRSQVDIRDSHSYAGDGYDDYSYQAHTMKDRPMTYHQDIDQPSSGGSQRRHHRSKSASPLKVAASAIGPSGYGYDDAPVADPYQRSASPDPRSQYRRSASPAPAPATMDYRRSASPQPGADYQRAASPTPQGGYYADTYQQPQQDPYRQSASPIPGPSSGGQPRMQRPVSPAPGTVQGGFQDPYGRTASPAPQQRRPQSQYDDSGSYADSRQTMSSRSRGGGDHSRSKSRQSISLPTTSSDGRKVIGYGRAMYDYRVKVAGEVGFKKGDILLILVMQEDGWWDVEVHGQRKFGLAPSNFLVTL